MSMTCILTVDAGNTHTRLAFWDEAGNLLSRESFLTAAIRDRHDDVRDAWWRLLDGNRPRFMAISCVAPAVAGILAAWTSETGISPTFATHRDVPLEMAIPHPNLAGIDRLVNGLAAWSRLQTSCLVIDMGTAVTWDVVLEPGIFAGGVIAPGLEVLAGALSRRTALPAVQPRPCADVLGRDTESCLRSGAWFGFLAQVEGIARRILERFPQIRDVILTGGTAPFVMEHLPASWQHMPLLTHEGLFRIAMNRLNEPAAKPDGP